MINEIRELIKVKSKICVSLDVLNLKELYHNIELLGDKVCIIKIHYDIIEDFMVDIDETIKKLNYYKKKYNFLIWEDRKFADIGSIMERQINLHISKWADMISMHPIVGDKSIENIKNINIILIGEMSSENNLFNQEYKNNIIDISNKYNNIIGIVCQNKMSENKLNIVPGISLNNKKDNKGQTYHTPQEKKFADILVIGRSIYKSENPQNEILKYL